MSFENFFKQLSDNIKLVFGSSSKTKEITKVVKDVKKVGEITGRLISFSDANYTCAEGSRICVGSKADLDRSTRLMYISKILERGHESILDHSNIVILVKLSGEDKINDFIQASEGMKFLNYSSRSNSGEWNILIGGSIRGYKYLLKNIKDISNNSFAQTIIKILYQSIEKEFFLDLILDGVMESNMFGFVPVTEVETESTNMILNGKKVKEEEVVDKGEIHQPIKSGKRVDIIYTDDYKDILEKVSPFGFTIRDALKVSGCTVIFHNISRAVSQQITRHNIGISQESQRYVNYSQSKFIDPTSFNEKQYPDKNKIYNVLFGTTRKKAFTSQDLGDKIQQIYEQLIKQGMLKQDARGYLPFNIATKLMVTFTYANLIHFIKVRTSAEAQPEIRAIATELHTLLKSSLQCNDEFIKEYVAKVELPLYKIDEEENREKLNSIDEVIGEPKEEIITNKEE